MASYVQWAFLWNDNRNDTLLLQFRTYTILQI